MQEFKRLNPGILKFSKKVLIKNVPCKKIWKNKQKNVRTAYIFWHGEKKLFYAGPERIKTVPEAGTFYLLFLFLVLYCKLDIEKF